MADKKTEQTNETELVRNIADTNYTTGEPITDPFEAAEERVKKLEEEEAAAAKRREEERKQYAEEHQKQIDRYNGNIK
jgi:hypothetical protein